MPLWQWLVINGGGSNTTLLLLLYLFGGKNGPPRVVSTRPPPFILNPSYRKWILMNKLLHEQIKYKKKAQTITFRNKQFSIQFQKEHGSGSFGQQKTSDFKNKIRKFPFTKFWAIICGKKHKEKNVRTRMYTKKTVL